MPGTPMPRLIGDVLNPDDPNREAVIGFRFAY
jgi:hypothetical protein